MLAESGLELVKERTKFLCTKYLHKIYSNSELSAYQTLKRLKNKVIAKKTEKKFEKRLLYQCIRDTVPDLQLLMSNNNYIIYKYDHKILNSAVEVNFKLGHDLKSSKDPNKLLQDSLNPKACTIYTDGSKSSNSRSVGSDCFSQQTGYQITQSIDKRASVFTAECVALLEAVKLAQTLNSPDTIILSDSLSALLALNTSNFNIRSNPYIIEIKKKFMNSKINPRVSKTLNFTGYRRTKGYWEMNT